MTHRTLALISLCGSALDILGSLYLAYDLLGGRNGPLRTLTRAVTYGVIFGAGYGLALGPVFGIASGITHGLTLGLEFARRGRNLPPYSYWHEVLFGSIRGLGFGVGAAWIYGTHFGVVFGILSALGQALAYRLGIRPTLDYETRRRPRITRRQLLSTVNRTVGYAVAGYIAAASAHHQMHAVMFGMEAGLTIGIVSAFSIAIAPHIEWLSDNMPDRRFGVLGVALLFAGFGLQSVQYWLSLTDIPVR